MKIKNEKKALQMFCATDGCREWMFTPFFNDMDEGRLMATDGYVIIRIDASLIRGKYEHRSQRIPPVLLDACYTDRTVLFSDIEEAFNRFVLVPEKVSKDGGSIECPECDGTGRVEYEYEDLSGNTHWHEEFCPICFGTGERPDSQLIETGRMILPEGCTFGLGDVIIKADDMWRMVSALRLMGFERMRLWRTTYLGTQVFSVGGDGIMVAILTRIEKGSQHIDITL